MSTETKKLTFNDLLMERGIVRASGVVVSITGESNKVYKSGWTGSTAEITLMVNGMKQKVKVFGGVGQSEFNVDVFQLDSEGKFIKDAQGKSVKVKINASQFNPTIHATFDKKEVMEWGERNAEGKATKIEHISELTAGRFANELLAKKELLIGQRVVVGGNVKFKPTQKFDKLEADIEVSTVTLVKEEEGRTYSDYFAIQIPMITDKDGIASIVTDGGIRAFVPVYHKYLTPIMKNGKEVKGRNVYVPFAFTVNDNGFLGLGSNNGYSIEDRADMFKGKLEAKSQGTPLAIFTGILNYKSGMIERDITVSELATDPVYGKYATQVLNGERDEADFKAMYKAQNPMTLKGEFKQCIDFININQTKDGDKICPIAKEHFEIMSLDRIKEESEAMANNKAQAPVQQAPKQFEQPKVATNRTSEVAPPPLTDISNLGLNESDFPF